MVIKLEEKYIKLLLKRCLQLNKKNPLFINYNKVNKDFVDKTVDFAKKLGINDIYLDEKDSNYEHDLLNKLSKEEIENHEYFDCKIWDEYAKKDAAFLLLDTEIPNLMDDIDSEKLALASLVKLKSKPIYRDKQLKSLIPWCIAAVPNEAWAKEILPGSNSPIQEFWKILADICMLNETDPIASWNKQLSLQAKNIKKLTEMNIKKIHIKNNLGTNLELELPDNALWQSACSGKWIVNLPSYEIFTTPDYRKTRGVVYSSKPLTYTGKVIDEFYLKFEDGKVVDFGAKEGKDVLEEIIKGDNLSAFLGEIALVNYDSPISNTNMVFKSTLLDENAACHLALGSGFVECIKDGSKLDDKKLDKLGVNSSKNHVDFMVGTKDLLVEVETKDGTIAIMENGNLVI